MYKVACVHEGVWQKLRAIKGGGGINPIDQKLQMIDDNSLSYCFEGKIFCRLFLQAYEGLQEIARKAREFNYGSSPPVNERRT